jgi:hypothetical protein
MMMPVVMQVTAEEPLPAKDTRYKHYQVIEPATLTKRPFVACRDILFGPVRLALANIVDLKVIDQPRRYSTKRSLTKYVSELR